MLPWRRYSASGDELVATHARSGQPAWRHATALYNPMAPAVAGGRLFLAGTTSALYAMNASTGAALWTSAALCPTHLWDVPAVAGDTVYVGSDTNAQLHALDVATGVVRWTFDADDAVRSPIVANGSVFFGTNQPWGPGSTGSLYALVA